MGRIEFSARLLLSSEFWIIEETCKSCRDGKCVAASLSRGALRHHRLALRQGCDCGSGLSKGGAFWLLESMAAGVIHVVVARLGIDGEQLVHKFHRADRGEILLVKLHRVDKPPSRVRPAAGVHRSKLCLRRDHKRHRRRFAVSPRIYPGSGPGLPPAAHAKIKDRCSALFGVPYCHR